VGMGLVGNGGGGFGSGELLRQAGIGETARRELTSLSTLRVPAGTDANVNVFMINSSEMTSSSARVPKINS